MLLQEVIITKLNITKAGQMMYFQIPLPRNAAFVEGIEVDTRFSIKPGLMPEPAVSGLFAFVRERMIGELKLQSCGRAGIFFSHDVKEERNIPRGDFSGVAPWFPRIYSHGASREIEHVWINGQTTMLLGSYRSAIGGQQIRYTVIVSVWVRIKAEEEKKTTPTTNDHCTSI